MHENERANGISAKKATGPFRWACVVSITLLSAACTDLPEASRRPMERLTQDVVRDLLSGISDAGGQRLAEVMSASDFEGSLSAALVSEVVGLEGAPPASPS